MTSNSSDPSLSIAVIGVGKIGSTFAYQLASAGHFVTAIARPGSNRLAQLQRHGGIVLADDQKVAVRAVEALDPDEDFDLVVVTVLDTQLDALLPLLSRSRAKAFQFMFVTLSPERITRALDPARCSFGMPAVMAYLDDAGRLHPTINPRQKTLHGNERWVDLFNAAGVPSAFEPNMAEWLRSHVPLTAAMEMVSVAGARRGKAAAWGDAVKIARGMKAGYRIISQSGHGVYPRSKRIVAALPTTLAAFLLRLLSGMKSFRDLLSQGEQEAKSHIAALLALGRQARVARSELNKVESMTLGSS